MLRRDIALDSTLCWHGEGVFSGAGFVNGCCDSSTENFNHGAGTLLSDCFTLSRRYLVFGFQCSAWNSETGLHLLINGERAFSVSDMIANARPRLCALDLSGLEGKAAQLLLNDGGSWESVRVEQPRLTDALPENAELFQPLSRCRRPDCTLTVGGGRYLLVPVDPDQTPVYCNIAFDGKVLLSVYLRLPRDGRARFYGSIPLDGFRADTVRIFAQDAVFPTESVDALNALFRISDSPAGSDNFYREDGRPRLHFTPPFGGNGDMVGFFHYKGLYHIFFLHDTVLDRWAENCSWGHAVSSDLLHWEARPMAIWKGFQTKKSSGCAFVDTENRSGLKRGEEDPILLFYSVEDQFAQRHQDFSDSPDEHSPEELRSACSVLYSTDGGTTFLPYEGNPIFLTRSVGGHDPEIIRYAPDGRFIMALHDRHDGRWGTDFLESTDLLHWNYMSSVAGIWETPNFYPLRTEDGEEYWILQECSMQYLIGQFDGRNFTPVTGKLRFFDGAGAIRTFSNMPDGRRILMGNMSIRFDSEEYHAFGGVTLPLEISLRNTAHGPRLSCAPARELDSLVLSEFRKDVCAADSDLQPVENTVSDLSFSWNPGDAFSLILGETVIFSRECGVCTVLGRELCPESAPVRVRLIIDEGVVSYFINDGLLAGCIAFPGHHIGKAHRLRFRGSLTAGNLCLRALRPALSEESLS